MKCITFLFLQKFFMLLWNQDNDEHCYWFDKFINECMAKDVGGCSSEIYRELARLVFFQKEYQDVSSK